MSWALSKQSQIYLSRGLVLVRQPQGEVREFRSGPNVEAEEMLAQAGSSLEPGVRLEIHLSAGLCPPAAIDYPAGLGSFAERLKYASSISARMFGLDAGDVIVELDAARPQTAAALPVSVWNALRQWSQSHGHRLERVRPLWSLATQSAIARRSSAFGLQEPDAVTLVSSKDNGDVQVLTASIGDSDHAQASLRRMRQAMSVESDAATLTFGIKADPPQPDLPRPWRGYWSMP